MSNEKYQRIKTYLQSNDLYLDDQDIEKLVRLSQTEADHAANVGYRAGRIKSNEREKAFHDQWMEENEPNPVINCGHGILQDLFIEGENTFSPASNGKFIEIITHRDRMIVATIVQWLGSNVGWSFLYSALERCGYTITKK